MEFIDKYNVIKAYDISNVYLPGFILIPCDKYGDAFLYDCDMIYYNKGKVLGYPSDKTLRKIENLSAYYKVVKYVAETITDIDRFEFRKRMNRIREEVEEHVKAKGGEIKPSIYDKWKADADMYDKKMNNQENLLPFNREFTPGEFEIYKEAYEKEWDNAIYKRAFSFDELKEKGSIKTELSNFFGD